MVEKKLVYYWQADHSYTNYLRKIDLVYDGADSITMNWFNKVFYKLRYYSIHTIFSTLPCFVEIVENSFTKVSQIQKGTLNKVTNYNLFAA